MSYRAPWLALAVASGACAAFNGVFAKLTTTHLTTSWSHAISTTLHLSPSNKIIEFLIRGFFFTLNLAFNALMWALFTSALTRASSTTRVSIVNTSANFLLTALLGLAVFSEKLPGMWWVGAGLLVVGNVVIGAKREEDGQGKGKGDGEVLPLEREEGGREEDGERYRDEGDEVNEGRVVDDDVLELEREVSVDGKQGGGRK
ncbi:MAG: hypothetical protein LQ338_002206 [Usnochroma carphineum]|nr:MAG: hypothetical protein LQ338_002206 [Usnochroma carphineum]